MKHVCESLREYENRKFFMVFEEEKSGTDKETLQSKEKEGLAVIDKITKNFDDFKKDANGEVLKYKSFWEENKQSKKKFVEPGDIYKLFDSDYVVGVLELPAKTLADGSLEGGLGATDEPEEEIIEGKEIMEAEESEEDMELDLSLTPGSGDDLSLEQPDEAPEEELPVDQQPMEQPNEEPMEQPVEEPMGQPVEEPTQDLTSPQTYFVVYDLSGGEREEIFRCGSNNVVKAFAAFYNDTFKGSMKAVIAQYKKQKEQEKAEAEKSEKAKKEKEKETKLQKFLGESEYEENWEDEPYPDEDDIENIEEPELEDTDNPDLEDWLDNVADYLRTDFEVEEEDLETFMDISLEKLEELYYLGETAFNASSTIAADEEIWEKLEELREETFDEENFEEDE